MRTAFANFVNAAAPLKVLLPLIHITDAFTAQEILDSGLLDPQPCQYYRGERILYCSYGRPAFRKSKFEAPSRLESTYPVCFILDGSNAGQPHRIYPFDTGGFSEGLYKNSMHPRMQRDAFSLGGDLNVAAQVATAFFGSNNDYYHNRVVRGLKIPERNYYVESYAALISDPNVGQIDARASTIEVQFTTQIRIRDACIGMVAPSSFLGDPNLRAILPNAKPLVYDGIDRSLGSWSGTLAPKVQQFLIEEKFL